MALPGVRLLASQHPEDTIIVAARKSVAPLWSHVSEVAETIVLPDSRFEQAKLFWTGAYGTFDRVLVLPHSFRAALFAWLTRGKMRRGLSCNNRGFLFTEALAAEPFAGMHQSLEYASILCGVPPGDQQLPAPALSIADEVVQRFRSTHGLQGRVLGLLPGAARGPSKQWPLDRYAALAKQMLAQGLIDKVVVLGAPNEVGLGEFIGAQLVADQWINLCGKTSLAEFPIALKSCDRIVCNDSGGMHVSAAVDVPLVAIFGTTNPAATGPLGKSSRVLQKSEKQERAVPRDCPIATRALEAIQVADVIAALQEF